jgi:hypothetical protein
MQGSFSVIARRKCNDWRSNPELWIRKTIIYFYNALFIVVNMDYRDTSCLAMTEGLDSSFPSQCFYFVSLPFITESADYVHYLHWQHFLSLRAAW